MVAAPGARSPPYRHSPKSLSLQNLPWRTGIPGKKPKRSTRGFPKARQQIPGSCPGNEKEVLTPGRQLCGASRVEAGAAESSAPSLAENPGLRSPPPPPGRLPGRTVTTLSPPRPPQWSTLEEPPSMLSENKGSLFQEFSTEL